MVLGYVILQNCANPASIESTVNLLLFFSSEIYHLPSVRDIWLGDERYVDPIASSECLECLVDKRVYHQRLNCGKSFSTSKPYRCLLLISAEISFFAAQR